MLLKVTGQISHISGIPNNVWLLLLLLRCVWRQLLLLLLPLLLLLLRRGVTKYL